jgi:ribonuclease-3
LNSKKSSSRFAPFERSIGYRFADDALLEQAFTHRSFGSPHNERLEFLGDSVLGCAIAEALCARFPSLPEGKLTRLRAGLVREESLVELAQGLGVARHMRLGEGERASGTEIKPSILANAMEAVFGAMFLDGGYAAARDSIVAVYAPRLDALNPEQTTKDAKTRLQEFLQAKRHKLPDYRVATVRGAAHRQTFEVECVVEELGLRAVGSGTSRQRAEQQAAEAVLRLVER